VEQIILEVVKWGMGIIGATVVVLVGIIAYFWRRDRKTIDIKFEKYDLKFDKIQEEVHDLAVTTSKAIGVLEVSVKNNAEMIRNRKG
jgi:hypothetical protein